MLPPPKLFIAGDWRAASDGRSIDVVNPSDGEKFTTIARGLAADVDTAVKAARAAAEGAWGRMPAVERGRLLLKLARAVQDNHETIARLESIDTGKPLKQGRGDATALARYFEYYGGAADKLHGDTIPFMDGYTVMTFWEPHGVTGHIIPWNYPSQIFGRSVGASLAVGNACVVKPAEDACLAILKITELAAEVGFPPGALNVVTGYGEEAGAALSSHPGIDHISFTGSPETGALVQIAAAKNNKPVTMELGGKSPQLVFADADLDAALPFLVNAIIQNAGQTCSAGSRLLVEKPVYDRVLDAVGTRFKSLRVGASDMDLDVGPVINKQQQTRVHGFLERAGKDGLKPAAQGAMAPNTPKGGYYVLPTLMGDVPASHELAQQEVFGPVLAATPFKDEAEALAIANGTAYGLVASVWTRDGGRQLRLARAIQAGQVFVNNYGAAGGIELPFGGYKRSGFGREKGFEGLYAFAALKTVAIRHG
ncbi:MAG: aldehyde dehydrogenase family protein [Alphaproteobacteria bacterium]|nr:aldehyde dehydrogenase family protein [Alphaproteobacteria bacterium]